MLEQLKSGRQSFSDFLRHTFEFMKMHYMEILPYTFAIGAVLGLVSSLISGLQLSAYFNSLNNLRTFSELGASTALYSLVSFVLNVAIAIAGLVVTAGVYKLIIDKINGKATNFMDVVNYLKSVGMPIVLTSIVVGLALFGLTLLLIVPGVYFGIKWSFYGLIAVNEGKYYFKATEASTILTQGRWITTLGYLIGISLIVGIPASIVGGIFTSILGGNFYMGYGYSDFNLVGYVLSQTINNAISFGFVTAVVGVFQSLVYINWMHFPAEAPKAYVPTQPNVPAATPVTEATVISEEVKSEPSTPTAM